VCVQPSHEPVTGSAPRVSDPETSPAASGESPPEAKPRRKGLRLWVAMVAGVAALLCLGGIGVAVLLYDKETKIERAAPDAVADNFLRAYLVDRDDNEASLYMCQSGADFGAISALRAEAVDREKKFGTHVVVSWGTLTVTDVDATRKNVAADLTIAGTSNGNTVSRRKESWSLGVVDQDGWRVCSATKNSS
jgi:hypothetical protein